MYKTKFIIPVTIKNDKKEDIETEALVDSGAQKTFIDKKLIQQHNLKTAELKTPFTISLANRSTSTQTIDETTTLETTIGKNHKEQLTYNITNSLTQPIILGLDWMK